MSDYEEKEKDLQLERQTEKWEIKDRVFRFYSYFLPVVTLFFLIAPIFMSAEQAKNYSEFSSIIITVIGVYGAVICSYYGADAMVKKMEAQVKK